LLFSPGLLSVSVGLVRDIFRLWLIVLLWLFLTQRPGFSAVSYKISDVLRWLSSFSGVLSSM
jgi:hypothetical protein